MLIETDHKRRRHVLSLHSHWTRWRVAVANAEHAIASGLCDRDEAATRLRKINRLRPPADYDNWQAVEDVIGASGLPLPGPGGDIYRHAVVATPSDEIEAMIRKPGARP